MKLKIILLGITLLVSCKEQSNPYPNYLNSISAEEIPEMIEYHNRDKALLINVWATWCGPCVEEFPHIVELANEYHTDLNVVFISADFPEDSLRAVEFLREQGVDWPTFLKTGKDEPFINALAKEWTGALPVTIIYNKNGQRIAFWEDKASKETFETQIQKAIN